MNSTCPSTPNAPLVGSSYPCNLLTKGGEAEGEEKEGEEEKEKGGGGGSVSGGK